MQQPYVVAAEENHANGRGGVQRPQYQQCKRANKMCASIKFKRLYSLEMVKDQILEQLIGLDSAPSPEPHPSLELQSFHQELEFSATKNDEHSYHSLVAMPSTGWHFI